MGLAPRGSASRIGFGLALWQSVYTDMIKVQSEVYMTTPKLNRGVVAPAVPASTIKTTDEVDAQREARRQGLRMLRGLNARREGAPLDGLQFQEEQREAW